VNRIWRAVGGRNILSKAARRYKTVAARALPVGRVPPPLTGRLVVWLTLHPPVALTETGQRWDIANREKLVCDALTAQRVWLDDSQIDAMIILRGVPCARGRVAVSIHVIPEGTNPL
jgi:crossover junction endodeoxyribonuclease RusA